VYNHAEEDIDGQAFLDLKEEEAKSLFPKLGHVKKVLRLQNSVTKWILLYYLLHIMFLLAKIP
jgi:hypothetical protein